MDTQFDVDEWHIMEGQSIISEEHMWSYQIYGFWTASLSVVLCLAYVWWHHPFIQLLWNLPRIYDWATELLSNSDNLTIRMVRPGGLTTYITANPLNVEHMLKTNFENYPKGEYLQNVLRDFLGTGILNVDDEPWSLQRRIASLEFSTRSLRIFVMDCVQKEVSTRLIPVLSRACQARATLDMQDILKRFNFDNICQLSLGMDPSCLNISLPILDFEQAFDDASAISASRMTNLPFVWSMMRALNLGSEKKLHEAVTKIRGFVLSVIHDRREQLQGGDVSAEQLDLLSRFMNVGTKGKKDLAESNGCANGGTDLGIASKEREVDSNEFLIGMVVSFLQAGRDTSAVTLSWFFWLLTCNRHVEEAIYADIVRIVKARLLSEDEASCKGKGTFSFEELKDMHYLQAAITESMRIYAPVPSNLKVAKNADVWPDGTRVPKNAMVSCHPYAMGRLERLWGSDCLEYKPERWLKDGIFVSESPYKFPVFQAGPRVCLGKDMAIMQMKLIAAALLQQFTLSTPDGYKPIYGLSFVLQIKNGLPVYVHQRTALI